MDDRGALFSAQKSLEYGGEEEDLKPAAKPQPVDDLKPSAKKHAFLGDSDEEEDEEKPARKKNKERDDRKKPASQSENGGRGAEQKGPPRHVTGPAPQYDEATLRLLGTYKQVLIDGHKARHNSLGGHGCSFTVQYDDTFHTAEQKKVFDKFIEMTLK